MAEKRETNSCCLPFYGRSVIDIIGIFLIIAFGILSAYGGKDLQDGIHLKTRHRASSLSVVECDLRLRLAVVNFSRLVSITRAYLSHIWPRIGNS